MFYTIGRIIMRKSFIILSDGVIGIQNAKASLFEEFSFSGAVVSEGLMVIEMLVSEVGEDGDFDRDTKSTKFDKGVRGNFENKKFGAGFLDIFDTLIKHKNIRGGHVRGGVVKGFRVEASIRGIRGGIVTHATPSNGSDKAGFMSGRVEHFPNHEAGSSLAIGAGNRNDAKLTTGPMMLSAGNDRPNVMVGKNGLIVKRKFLE